MKTRINSSIAPGRGRGRRGALAAITALTALFFSTTTMADGCGCLGDLNGDGQVNGADLGALLAVWGTNNANADLNHDGIVNGADLGIVIAEWGPCAAPSNDNCAIPLIIGGPVAFCNEAATTDGPSLAGGGCGSATQIYNDLWYQYTPLTDGILTVDTCSANFDTVLAIYSSGAPGVNVCPSQGSGLATLVACNDDNSLCGVSSLHSYIQMSVLANHIYKIRVGGFSPAEVGSGVLNLGFVAVGGTCETAIPANNFVPHQVIHNDTVGNPLTTVASCVDGPSPGTWIKWTASCDGSVTLSTCHPATDFDTVLTVVRSEFDGQCWSTFILCNDDTTMSDCMLDGFFRKTKANFICTPNALYYFVVTGYNGASGTFDLSIDVDCN